MVRGFEDPAEAERFLAAMLRQIQVEAGSLAATCVTARTTKGVNKLATALGRAGFSTRVIEADQVDGPRDPALRLANKYRVRTWKLIRCSRSCSSSRSVPCSMEPPAEPGSGCW